MFGYVIANPQGLDEQRFARYKSFYCGLCRTLKARYSGWMRLTLTYDMTFLALLENALYEPEETSGMERCAVHPVKTHAWIHGEFTDYAADLSVLLTYLKCMDDWDDDCDPIRKAEASVLRPAYEAVCLRYPRQSGVIRDCMAAISGIERRRDPNPDAAANCFGILMGELFVCREDRWSDTLRAMGAALGRFIYLMDAVVDQEKDQKRFRYNPLEALPDTAGDHYRAALEMLLGRCVFEFDKLPIVKDADILRNILCSGVWTVYLNKFDPPQKGAPDDTGSL
ncbi:MAG TPA: DUF5685 family protein [Oscillospiraceae bacterium]|nr:DUF5685 family protein [Oscillospiraceae bacterium]HPS75696.1 DUF5685 family protein [Oscillospiraceae bacterium]